MKRPEYIHVEVPEVEALAQSRLESMQYKDSRFYCSPTSGLWFPSVTTVLGWGDREFFKQWSSMSEKNRKKSEDSRIRGDYYHEAVEYYLKNHPSECFPFDFEPGAIEMLDNVRPALHEIEEIVMLETPLWSDRYRIAGRVDCIAMFRGRLSIIDFKGAYGYKQARYIHNYFQQKTAYALMFEELTGYRVDQIVTLISVQDESSYQVFVERPQNYVEDLLCKIIRFETDNRDLIDEVNRLYAKADNK